ncbi:hypothetical protein ACH5RR_041012 [Cinchona calisaya]|uniref:TF-B3 domain-containing protein n=1 Tax=Cinchona calisaya TaxID=153742 RepID=A0ABD2XXR4_9GENT
MARPSKSGNMGGHADSQKSLKFFKVFNAAKYSNQLHIPSAYTLYMQGNLPDKAVLRDRFGNMWHVKLAKVGNEWFFQKGWSKIVQDNAIEHTDLLVFLFDGDKNFYFKIIGRNSCEKEGVGSLKFQLDKEDKGDEEEKEKEELNKVSIFFPKSELSCSALRKLGNKKKGQECASTSQVNRERDIVDWFGASIFRSGEHAQPRNPYFVTKIRQDKPKALYIPPEVIEIYKLDLPPKLTLCDPLGRTWLSKLHSWKDGRAFYTGGWESLCKENFIDEADSCVCEFVRQHDRGTLVIQIQIVRSGNALETCKTDRP